MFHHRTLILQLALSLLGTGLGSAQSAGVPVYPMGKGSRRDAAVLKACASLRAENKLLPAAKVDEQSKRQHCQLTLPPASATKLDSRELWRRSRQAHLRLGWYYLCGQCDRWHLDLAGGYAITTDCVATCGHILGHEDMKEAYLIAVDEAEQVIPVTEVLAVNLATDSAIFRLATTALKPLPMGFDVVPGDHVWCYSDPIDRRGFYSEGVVNQFVQRPFLRPSDVPEPERKALAEKERPIFMTVSSDWAPGSSGSAVLDAAGNAVAHVSEIQAILEDPPASNPARKAAAKPRGTVIIFHDAIAASNVRALVR